MEYGGKFNMKYKGYTIITNGKRYRAYKSLKLFGVSCIKQYADVDGWEPHYTSVSEIKKRIDRRIDYNELNSPCWYEASEDANVK